MKKKAATKKAQTKKQPDRTENTKPTRTRGLCECGALVNTDFPWMQVHKPDCAAQLNADNDWLRS